MDSGSERYDKLLAQCKANDVDLKVDALNKLQVEFEKNAIQIADPDILIGILKTSLRTSNVHLTNATLAALPVILPHLVCHAAPNSQPATVPLTSSSSTVPTPGVVDALLLRQVLTALLPAGGLIDRLGDKERAQLKARDSLVIIGGYTFRAGGLSTLSSKSGKSVEPPIVIYERFLKEVGLASKVWKVREQSILTLVHIRRDHHLFPMRPYLSNLVDCLEDTDPHVRECARVSIVELFSGPGVTDAARADLKKELIKKNVRKTIVDGVLSKLLGGSTTATQQTQESSEEGVPDKKDYIPPSLALQSKRPRVPSQTGVGARIVGAKEIPRPLSRTAVSTSPPPSAPTTENPEIQPVYIASTRDLEGEFAAMAKPFEGKETEHNWLAREQAILRVRGMIKGDIHHKYADTFFVALKDGFVQWSLKTLSSLRTTVAVNTCMLYSELAVALGSSIDPMCDLLLTNLLKMAAFTKKITAQQSQNSVTAIITHTSAPSRIIVPLLWQTLQEKTVQARAYVVNHLKVFIEVHGYRSRNAIESSGSLEIIEKSLKKALSDPNPAVKQSARELFWVFDEIWHDRSILILESLDAAARKQLEKACPNPDIQTTLPATPKPTKKTSVAAAIAASRAKAKAIATAPPSLRHQATATSHGLPSRRLASPNTSPMNSTARPGSPQRTTTSSSTRRTRVVSAALNRSTSAPVVVTSHSRTPSGSSDKAERSGSPSSSDSNNKRHLYQHPSNLGGRPIGRNISQPTPPNSPPSSTKASNPRTSSSPLRHGPIVARKPLSPRAQTSNKVDYHESLLLAQTIPIPDDDSDLEGETSVNLLMSFSTPFETHPPAEFLPTDQDPTLSPVSDSKITASVSNALSSSSFSERNDQPIVEDALKARAEQAESAAERLLELVEPDDDAASTLPPSLLRTIQGQKVKAKPTPLPMARNNPPVTPKTTRAASIMKQAAMFVDSPAQKPHSSTLLDVLRMPKRETTWNLKKTALFAEIPPITSMSLTQRTQELEELISSLNRRNATVDDLKRLCLICRGTSVSDFASPPPSPGGELPSSPTPQITAGPIQSLDSASSIWETDKTFDRFFKSLVHYLEPSRNDDELTYGFIVIWEIIANQTPYLEGKEGDLFLTVLRARYCNRITVLEGANAVCDALTAKLDPVYGLTTMHASLRVFQTENPPNLAEEEVKASTVASGLMTLGKFILRLPAEIAEEELPRLKGTLISSLNDEKSLIVRESAATCIIAAQLVLRDETHLFALLDGLTDDKKNFLTYLFDKHGATGVTSANGPSGMDKFEREIRRLDTRTSTPLRNGL